MLIKRELKYMAEDLIGAGRLSMWRHRSLVTEGHRAYDERFKALIGSPKNILTCCPNHCNIGDHAIAVAERRMLATASKRPFLSFVQDPTNILSCLEKYCTPDDVIYMHGGGNMGTLYRNEEDSRLSLISTLKHNRIILFPQTMSYDDDVDSQRFLRHTQRIYKSHPDLHLFARERVSYERMREAYPDCDVQLVPDIVLSIGGEDDALFGQRHGALLCMRNDVEKKLERNSRQQLERIVSAYFGGEWRYTDTTIGSEYYPLSEAEGEKYVLEKWSEFKSARLVLTDRLHGMIFSAITGTPCVALNNANGKVGFEYEWLKDLPYIAFVEDSSDMDKVGGLVRQVLEVKEPKFPSDWFLGRFSPLLKLIQ